MTNPFTLISTHEVYSNPWIQVREDSVIRPGWGSGVFGIVNMKDGVTVIALDEEENIITTNEFAYALDKYSLELVSGWMDTGETPLDCAKRELAEETWYIADEWMDLGFIDPFTTVIRSRNYIFLARSLRYTKPNPDEGEILNVSKIPFQKALEMVMNSEITHGASVVAILKAQQYIKL